MSSETKVVEEVYVNVSKKDYDRHIRRVNGFDYYWRIGLMIILLLALFYMFYEWRQIDKEAMDCKNSPFDWGKQKALENGFYCYYSCAKQGIANIELLQNYSLNDMK